MKSASTLALITLIAVSAVGRATAACIGAGAGILRPLELQAFRDPIGLLLTVRTLEQDQAASLTPQMRATLRAIAGEAYRQLDRVTPALNAANEGLRLMGAEPHAPLSIRLRLLRALMLDDTNDTTQALKELDALIMAESSNPQALACARKDRGWIRDSTGDTEGALRDLIAAYQYLDAHGPKEEAMVAAGRLAAVYRVAGEYDAATSLVRESLDYFTSIGAWVRAATAHDRLGNLYLAQRRYAEAIAEFDQMRRLSITAHDVGGAAYADLWTCNVNLEQQAFALARDNCRAAEVGLKAIDTVYPSDAAMLQEQQARIALGFGQVRDAIRHFRASIDTKATELKGRLGLKVYRGLSAAEAQSGDYAAAYAAALEYESRLAAVHNEQTSRELAALRVRFEMDRRIAENLALTRERTTLLDRNARAAGERMTIILAAILSLVAAVAGFFLLSQRRVAEAGRRAAEQRVEDLGRLCAAVAHDFNNLMTVVQQAAGMLRQSSTTTREDSSVQLIDAIRDAATAGGDITRQLLAFGRQQQMKPELIVCDAFFTQQRTLLQQAVGDSADIHIQPIDPSMRVWADPRQLTNALINLVLNARDAISTQRDITLEVSISASVAASTEITVRDTGCGMDPDTLRRCSEVFFSTKEPGRGSGLGLSAIQGFASQSGGSLRILSQLGEGTVVTIILPNRAMPMPQRRAGSHRR